jgi:hypothetical protein
LDAGEDPGAGLATRILAKISAYTSTHFTSTGCWAGRRDASRNCGHENLATLIQGTLARLMSVNEDLRERLESFLSAGGRLILGGTAALDAETGEFGLNGEKCGPGQAKHRLDRSPVRRR